MGSIYFPTTPTDPRPAVPVVVNVGKVSQVLAMYDLQKNDVFKGGSKAPDNRLWLLLCVVSEVLDWFNTNLPDHEYVEVIANYLWALITPYQIAALRALGNGGGIVINPATGAPLNIAQFRYDFTVGQAGSLMSDGDTSLTINLTYVFLAQFEPSGINETIGDDTQASLTNIVYNVGFVRFELNQPVRNGERYITWGLRGGNITSIPTGGVQLPQPYKAGKFLTNDGTNLIWDDVWIPITAADFEPDGKTYINSTLAGYYLGVIWENVGETWLDFEAGEATLIDGGGFIVNIDGFDTTQNPDWKFKVFKKSLP